MKSINICIISRLFYFPFKMRSKYMSDMFLNVLQNTTKTLANMFFDKSEFVESLQLD